MKGEHKCEFAYEAHTACIQNGFVLVTVVTPGNVHNSVAFDDVYDGVTEAFPEIETVVSDFAYKTPYICMKVFTDGRVLSTTYKRPQTMKGGHEWWKYVYDEYYDCILCPEYPTLVLLYHRQGGLPGVQKRSKGLHKLSHPPFVYPIQRLCKDRAAAYLERV